MPIIEGTYFQRSESEIRSLLETELQTEFGADIDLTESSVFTTLVNALAAVHSENQEQSLQEVYRSAFLDTATGVDLDRVVELIGLQRRSAIHSTGVERFIAPEKVTQSYTIQSGSMVQTDSDSPIQFETTESTSLELFDDFETANPLTEYSGDTTIATVVETNAVRRSHSLELDGTGHVYKDEVVADRGTTIHGHVRPSTGTLPSLTFGIDPQSPTDFYEVAFDADTDTVTLNGPNGEIDSTSATIDADTYYEAEISWAITGNIGVTVRTTEDEPSEVTTLGGVSDEVISGHVGFRNTEATNPVYFDWYTTSETSANIRAISGGAQGNVGSNSITVQPSPNSGVDTVTNLYPTGTTDYRNTDEEVFVIGRDEETDDELRERARETVTGGGSATANAIIADLINEVDGVTSVTLYENKTADDNTGTGGLPPFSFEAVVFGGQDLEVAESIFDNKAVTSHDYGGVHGTEVTETVSADSNGQIFEISFTRPTEIEIDMSIDIIVDETYVGDDDLRDQIAQYIGGTLENGSEVLGLEVGDNVRIDVIRDIVIGEENGVVALDQSVDGSPIETTPTYTTIDGIEAVDIGPDEVAQTNAMDASITINTREQ